MSPTSISVSWKHEHETFFHSTEKYNISYRGVNHSNTHSYTPTPKPNPCGSISKVAQIRNFHATCIIISRLVLANSRLEIKCFFFYREVEREREREREKEKNFSTCTGFARGVDKRVPKRTTFSNEERRTPVDRLAFERRGVPRLVKFCQRD